MTETPIHALMGAVYDRCVAARQWQNAAAIRGCSQHAVRMDHDAAYRRQTLRKKTKRNPSKTDHKPKGLRP